jgi:hypothetical protein
MTRVRVLVFCADDDLRYEIDQTVIRLADSPDVTRKCVDVLPAGWQIEDEFPWLGPGVTSVDVLFGIAVPREGHADDVRPMVEWLSGVEAHVWRVALVVAGYRQEVADRRALGLLQAVDRSIPGQPVLVHLTWTATIRRAFLGALVTVLARAADTSPSPAIMPRMSPAEETCQWVVDIILSRDGLMIAALGGLKAIRWHATPSVCAYRVGDVTLTDPEAATGEPSEPMDWTRDPEVPGWWQTSQAGAVLAMAEPAPDGTLPEHFLARLAQRPDLYSSTALCLILPASVTAELSNQLMAEQWQRLSDGTGPRVCVHLSSVADLLNVWHTLTRVSPVISQPFYTEDTLWPESPDS